jgi:Phage integrase, N-terminal SAM-like domain
MPSTGCPRGDRSREARAGVDRARAATGRVVYEAWGGGVTAFHRGDRERKPSTRVDYRSALKAHLLPAFGERPLESIEPADT